MTIIFKLKSNHSFFLEQELYFGNTMKVRIDSTGVLPECAYLPRRVADSIPFSSDHFDDILSQLSISPDSFDAAAIKDTLEVCEWPAMKGEGKTCTTSLEAMVELAREKIGEGAKAIVTKMEADTSETRAYTVGWVELKGKGYMSCHRLTYPYAVHYCHELPDTVVYEVLLVRDDGMAGQALAVCHRDTSDWSPELSAFKRLNVKPGNAAICHHFPKGHLLWVGPDSPIKQVV